MINLESFRKKLSQICADFPQKKFLLAVSGGADSMVLATLFLQLQLEFQIAHINYKLRGKDSDDDEKLVDNFCKKNNIRLSTYRVTEKDHQPKGSIQLWARNLRYEFFNKILFENPLDFMVTAHHLNDNLETFLIHLSRGSGIHGLKAIPEKNGNILRPLLEFSKEEIYAYAKENNIQFREDLSNKKNDYLRNEIRNEIVPKLLKTNEHFLENFKKSIRYLCEAEQFIEENIQSILKKISLKKENEILIDKNLLKEKSAFIQYEILKEYGFTDDKEIQKIFSANTGKHFESDFFLLFVNRDQLVIRNRSLEKDSQEKTIIVAKEYKEKEIKLSDFLSGEFSLKTTKKIWNFDAEKLSFPLLLRHKKAGDFFYPSGMNGKKKISKFLKDEKLPIFAKPEIWLLCDGNDTVLGVLPIRQDNRFLACENSKKIISFILEE